MKTTAALGLALVLTLATGVRAQDEDPKTDPVPAKADEPVEEEAAKPAPEPEPDPEPVSGVRYRIALKSGRVLDGVIRARGVFERRARSGGYEPADDTDEGSGVRIWFPSQQDGFIFMPLTSIGRMDELGSLSVDEGKTIAKARIAAKRRADGERKQIRDAAMAAEEAAAEQQADDAAAADEAAALESVKPRAEPVSEEEAADQAALAALLIKYPPTRWSLESPAEIERRKVVLGLFPSDEEKAFLATFEDWKRAYTSWLEANGEEVPGEKRPEKAKRPKKRSPRPRPKVERPETPSWNK